ncbi:MAG TPA: NADH-quinone oxidoreductase subunit C [Ignavibacteria bacterium]|nr:NADH-quinone oxidoreductase subunit C [Ignavibacteria bacterium]
MRNKQELQNLLHNKLAGYNIVFGDVNGDIDLTIPAEQLIEVCNILRNDPELGFDWLVDAVGVDRFQKNLRFEIIYNLRSRKHKDRLFFRVKVSDSKNPESPSVSGIWGAADWYEREAYDMVGIKFTGHPDLRRMYMPDEFEYYPLRKDFPLMGIPGSLPLPNK